MAAPANCTCVWTGEAEPADDLLDKINPSCPAHGHAIAPVVPPLPANQRLFLADRFLIGEPGREIAGAPETVDHPAHYNQHPSGVECIDVVEHMSFNLGNAVKYLWRADHKAGGANQLEDLRKAVWYLQREIDRVQGGRPRACPQCGWVGRGECPRGPGEHE